MAGEPWEPSSLTLLQADELAKLDKWLAKTEERLDGGKIIVSTQLPKPGNRVVALARASWAKFKRNTKTPRYLSTRIFLSSSCSEWSLTDALQKPESIVDACQALSKARELRALFEKKEKPLITAKVIHHMLSMCHVATRS